MMRAFIAAAAAALLAQTAAAQGAPYLTPACTASPLDVEEGIRVGALDYRGGLHLVATASGFGGVSGLDDQYASLAPGGVAELSAVSDRSGAVMINVQLEDGRPVRAECLLGPLNDVDGQPLARARRDAEAIVVRPQGPAIISFERRHRIMFYDAPHATPRPGPVIGGLDRLENNQSFEALAVLADGALIAGAETPSVLGRAHPVWRFASSSDEARPFDDAAGPAFRIASEPGFGLAGFAVTPAGNLITLQRFFTPEIGVRIKLGWLARGEAETAGGRVSPRVLARLNGSGPVAIDNFEGVAASRGQHGETLVWLVSDDNFNAGQRTLLQLFAFDETAFANAAE